MDLYIYIASGVGIVLGSTFVAMFSFSLCSKFFGGAPKEGNPPPSPLCKRQVSIHAAYPPTPHIARLPQPTRGKSCPDSPLDSPLDEMKFHLPPNFQAKKPRKQSSKRRTFKRLASFTLSLSSNSSTGSFVVQMPSPSPKEEKDLPLVHDAKGKEPAESI